jgi:hypothetical protein
MVVFEAGCSCLFRNQDTGMCTFRRNSSPHDIS